MTDRRPNRKCFTLIEVLAAIAVIAILAGLVLGISRGVNVTQNEAKTKAKLEQMMSALQEHYQDRGYYPIQVPGPANFDPFKHSQTGRPYLDKYVAGEDYLDSWEEPFLYEYQTGDQHYKLWSKGPDRVDDDGENDDIASWKRR